MKPAPINRFVFYVHKPKARKLAGLFTLGAKKAGYECIISDANRIFPSHLGVFYGVVPDTYKTFEAYLVRGQAIYLDNGWLSSPEEPTLRFSWNGAQPFAYDIPPFRKSLAPPLDTIVRNPKQNLALLVMQTPDYFKNLRLPYSRDRWKANTVAMLEGKGYKVEIRDKPRKGGPKQPSLNDQLARKVESQEHQISRDRRVPELRRLPDRAPPRYPGVLHSRLFPDAGRPPPRPLDGQGGAPGPAHGRRPHSSAVALRTDAGYGRRQGCNTAHIRRLALETKRLLVWT